MCIRIINSDNIDSHSENISSYLFDFPNISEAWVQVVRFLCEPTYGVMASSKSGTVFSDRFYCKDIFTVLEVLIVFRN